MNGKTASGIVLTLVLICGCAMISSVISSPTYEDFTTYTEVDDDEKLTVTSTRIRWALFRRGDTGHLYKSYGTGHFGDFEHWFDLNLSTVEAGDDSNRDFLSLYIVSKTSDLSDKDCISIYLRCFGITDDQYNIGFVQWDGGFKEFAVESQNVGDLNPVYFVVKRDGTTCTLDGYSTKALREAGDDGDIVHYSQIGVADTYEYITVARSFGFSDDADDYSSGYVENLQLREPEPIITILSPQSITYTANSVPLTFTVDKPTSWIGYSLDDQPTVTISGNITLTGLFSGVHAIIVYANDTAGNMGASDKVFFTIKLPRLSIELAGELDYLRLEQVKIRLAGLLRDADTMRHVSDADVTLEIYKPDGGLMTSGVMTEYIPQSGVYEWQSDETIKGIRLEKGIYLVYVKASYSGATTSSILEFHIDPPAEEPVQLFLISLFIMANALAISISLWFIDHRSLSRRVAELERRMH